MFELFQRKIVKDASAFFMKTNIKCIYWFLGEPATSSANSVPGNKDNSEDLEVAVPQIPRFQEGEFSRSQDLCSTSSNIVTVHGAPNYSGIQGASHTQAQLYCEHLSEMPEIDCWVYFGPEDKNIKLNVAIIANAVQVSLWQHQHSTS